MLGDQHNGMGAIDEIAAAPQACSHGASCLPSLCLLMFILSALWGCDREPGLIVNIATWPDGVERIRVRTTIGDSQGADIYLAKNQTRFAVRVPVGSQGTVQLLAVGLDAVGCKLVSSSLAELVPSNLSRFVERTLEFSPEPAAPVCLFRDHEDYFVGQGLYSVGMGDFNGDMKPDLAAVINTTGLTKGVHLLLGKGDGTFDVVLGALPVGTGPGSVAVGNFNGDMKPDLAVANFQSRDVSVLLGNGVGGFGDATNFLVGVGPYSVAVGDFNGDMKSDLAVANKNTNDVSVLLGNGTGSFDTAKNFYAGTSPISVAVGDFNGDSHPDLAVATSNGVSVLLGDGLGAFDDAKSYPVGTNPTSVAVEDFNGDRKLDLALANATSNDVSVLLGNGAGGFRVTNFPVGRPSSSVAVGDFDGDKKPDLAVVSSTSGFGDVSVLLGDGMGGFGPAAIFLVGNNPTSVAVGDFDGDTRPDLAVANFTSGNVSVLLNQF
jgi:hypothetical protein